MLYSVTGVFLFFLSMLDGKQWFPYCIYQSLFAHLSIVTDHATSQWW